MGCTTRGRPARNARPHGTGIEPQRYNTARLSAGSGSATARNSPADLTLALHAPAFLALAFVALTVLAGCGALSPKPTPASPPLLEGLGEHHFGITTRDKMAQRLFDQGFVLYYGFNHAEAKRSFLEAARIDPECALCWWGAALTLGPNINVKMEVADGPEAYALAHKAAELAARTTPVEQALIGALVTRYAENAPANRAGLDSAYASAMRDVAASFPNDADVLTLYAESLMDLSPWDYWTQDLQPKAATPDLLAALESALAVDPECPGANHLWMHAVELGRPADGVPAADRLGRIVPGAGHLVHMPAHIYLRVGRYHDASLANERAIQSDQSYLAQCHQQGIYPLAYVPHNTHFLWASETLEGRSVDALATARELAQRVDTSMMRQPGFGTLQHYWVTPLYAMVRFGKWQEILQEPEPPPDLLYPRGVWHYARGMALTRTGRLDAAAAELEALAAIAADSTLEKVTLWDINTTASLMRIATEVLAGELALGRGDPAGAVERLRAAVQLEDDLRYDEPPPWHYPTRQSLGAALLAAGDAAGAERAYRDDLTEFPDNGWSLFGLEQSLRAQGRTAEADEAQEKVSAAWRYADVQLTASRF